MKKLSGLLAAALVVAAASPASALGLKYGARVGYGMGMPDPSDGIDSASSFNGGLAVLLDLMLLGVEVDALYHSMTFTAKKDLGGKDTNLTYLAIPVLARGSFPLIPAFLSLDFGGGLEQRFLLGATFDGKDEIYGVKLKDQFAGSATYLPILVGATLDLKVIQANLDIRYERDLTDLNDKGKSAKNHELMLVAGAFF